MEMTSFLNGLKKMYIVYLKICVMIVIMFNVHVKSILQKMSLSINNSKRTPLMKKITNMLDQKLRKII